MDITTNGILKLSPEIRENMFLKMKWFFKNTSGIEKFQNHRHTRYKYIHIYVYGT